MDQSIKHLKYFIGRGEAGKRVVRYEWKNWSRVLQSKRRSLWRRKHWSQKKVVERAYRMDEFSEENWDSIAASIPAAYALAAVSSLLFAVLLARIPEAAGVADPSSGKGHATLATLFDGIHYLRRTRVLLAILSLDMFAVLLGGAVYLLPVFAEDVLSVGATGLGYLHAAPATGALLMALALAHLPPLAKAGRALLISVAGFGLATIVFGLSTNLYLSLIVLFLTGAFDQVSMVVRHTMVQLTTPDAMRGRVSAVNGVFVSASNELGGFESGLVAHWFGPVIAVVSGGIGTLMVVAVTAWASPQLRRFGSLGEIHTKD